MKMYIGKNIKHYRELSGLTQAELASALGVSSKLVWSWESNRTEPKAGHVQQMITLFGCTSEDLCKQLNLVVSYDEYRLIETLRGLSDKDRRDAMRYITYLKSISEVSNG